MPKTKEEKKKIIEELREKVKKQRVMLFVSFKGLKTKDFSTLRKKLKETGNELKVAKKTLAQLVFDEKGINIDLKKPKGELALVFGYKDEILPAKIVWQFSQGNPHLKILGGFFENNFLESEKIIELAKLPTKEELLAKLVESMVVPILNLVNVFKGNFRSLIYILSQIKVQGK